MSGILKVGGSELINDNGGSGSLQWGTGLPSGSIVQVQHTQFDTGAEHSTMSANTDYVLQNNTNVSSASGGSYSGILDVDITPKINGSKIWLTSHIFGEANTDEVWNLVFFFWRSVSSPSSHTKLTTGVSGKTDGASGISMATRTSNFTNEDSTPEIVNMQYFDTHGVSAGTQITYKVGLATGGNSTAWHTSKTAGTHATNEAGVSSICAIELAP